MKHFLLALFSVFSLAGCTTPSVEPAAQQASEDVLPPAWPRCPSLESSWGAARGPSMEVTGGQAMTYVKPGKAHGHVNIVYEGKNPRFPVIRDYAGKLASDGQMTIMGQRVDFYGSGNEDMEISTQPMQLTSPAGDTAWFSFSFSAKEHLEGKNIPAFTW